MTTRKSALPNFVKLFERRGFIIPKYHGDKIQYEYGPLGTLLRQNVTKQWWNGISKQTHSSVYPVECSPLVISTNDNIGIKNKSEEAVIGRESLNKECLNHLKHLLKLTNRQLPFSLATSGLCVHSRSQQLSTEERILNGGTSHTQLLLQNYVPPTDSGRAMDLWLQMRLSWWKHFARNPALFTQTKLDKKEADSASENVMSIYFEFPWGKQSVETIHNTRDTYLWQATKLDGGDYMTKATGNRDVMAHVIECSTVLELATLAWLCDAYNYRDCVQGGKNRNVLHLHPQLAPYQVAVVRETSEDTSYTQKIGSICSHVVKCLKLRGLSVLNASEHGNTLPLHILRCNELGIPYTLILDETTLEQGCLQVRVRDTEVPEIHHITEVPDLIEGYVKAELHSKALLREQEQTHQFSHGQPDDSTEGASVEESLPVFKISLEKNDDSIEVTSVVDSLPVTEISLETIDDSIEVEGANVQDSVASNKESLPVKKNKAKRNPKKLPVIESSLETTNDDSIEGASVEESLPVSESFLETSVNSLPVTDSSLEKSDYSVEETSVEKSLP